MLDSILEKARQHHRESIKWPIIAGIAAGVGIAAFTIATGGIGPFVAGGLMSFVVPIVPPVAAIFVGDAIHAATFSYEEVGEQYMAERATRLEASGKVRGKDGPAQEPFQSVEVAAPAVSQLREQMQAAGVNMRMEDAGSIGRSASTPQVEVQQVIAATSGRTGL